MRVTPGIITRSLWLSLLKSCVFTAMSLIVLQVAFTLLGESGSIKADYTFLASLEYSIILSGPGSLRFILPLVVLISTLLVLGSMSDNSELVVLQTSGMSASALFARLVPIGLILSLSILALEDRFFLPLRNQAMDSRDTLRGQTKSDSGSIALRQGNNFLISQSISPTGSMGKTYLFDFNASFDLKQQILAESADIKGESIVMHTPLINNFSAEDLSVEGTRITPDYTFPTSHSQRFLYWLSLHKLTDTTRLGLAELWEFSKYQRQLNPNNNQFLQVFYNRLFLPFNVLVFMLLALPFIFGSNRSMYTSTKITIALMIGLVFINFQQLTLPLNVVFGWPAIVVAAFPGMLTLLLVYAINLLRRYI